MKALTLTIGRVSLTTALLLSLVAVRPAHAAGSLSLMWDPNPEAVAGYAVYVGATSGSLSQRYDVGNTTTFNVANPVPGQQYCFAVSAYVDVAAEGPRSTVLCGFSDQFPTLANPGNQATPVGQAVSLQLVGSDPDGQAVTFNASGLPPGLSLMAGTGFISGSPTTAGSYSVTVSVSDGVLSSAPQSFSWSVSAPSAADTTAPTVSITSPTAAATLSWSSWGFVVAGTAGDNVGVTQVSWANSRGGSGVASGTTSWSTGQVSLQLGTNVVTVTARDAAGNVATDTLTVTYGSSTDTTAPVVAITSPTTASTYSTGTGAVTLGGTASDAVGVTQVSWTNSAGGSGTAAGTTSWSTGSIALQAGVNVLTVTARDAAGNTGTAVQTVTYTAPGPAPSPSLTLSGAFFSSGKWTKVLLSWSVVSGRYIDIYRDGVLIARTVNDGSHTDGPKSAGPFSYYVCVSGTTQCSNTITVN